MTINYGYDSSGRLNGVTGSDNLVGGVSNYSSDFQYRAWGAVKSKTYGNTVSESAGYNVRLQPTSYTLNNTNYTNTNTLPGVNYSAMTWTFDYYNDGRLHYAWDATNNWFDRA